MLPSSLVVSAYGTGVALGDIDAKWASDERLKRGEVADDDVPEDLDDSEASEDSEEVETVDCSDVDVTDEVVIGWNVLGGALFEDSITTRILGLVREVREVGEPSLA